MTISPARIAATLATILLLAGCVVYDPYYAAAPNPAAAFDRSWSAAAGALSDQGVQIVNQDRGSGVIEGRRGGITVKARVFTRADGSVQVEFNTSGTGAESQNLSAQVSRSYDARMGR
jgi:hypothetical protein